MRALQKKEDKGSQKWIQKIINACPDFLNALIREQVPSLTKRDIIWLSPLEKDGFAEYRDAAFLQRIGLPELTPKLGQFWPKNGPQWDALGKTVDNEAIILVEAKANVAELISTCSAKDETSLGKISKSLDSTKRWLKCRRPLIDWQFCFYQYANRLAHLYFLRSKCRKEAFLLFIYFVNDSTHISTSREAWNGALELQMKLLGLPAECLAGKVIDLFINTEKIIEV
jgi:hypothetical protein